MAISFWIKLVFIFVELGLAIAFGVLGDKKHYNSAAIVEWTIALIYTFYVWRYVKLSILSGEISRFLGSFEFGSPC